MGERTNTASPHTDVLSLRHYLGNLEHVLLYADDSGGIAVNDGNNECLKAVLH